MSAVYRLEHQTADIKHQAMNTINWPDYIAINPGVMLGKPVIKNTRIPVDLIIEKLAFGESVDEILLDYPHISRDAILACLHYATYSLRNEVYHELAA
jgi:uncharacterized protein (DUF433 family)